MDAIIERLNSAGAAFLEFAVPMLVQSSLLIFILLLVDLALRKKVRAVFRYWIWLLVLAKLVLPSSLSSPMSLGYFFGEELAEIKISEAPVQEEPFEWKLRPAPRLELPDDIFGPAAQPDTQAALPVENRAEQKFPEIDALPATSVTVTWQGAVFLVWLVVVVAMGLLLLQRAMFVRGLVAQAHQARPMMNDALKFCRQQMRIKREVQLKVSPNAASPAVCGLFRPVILVPANLGRKLGSRDLRAVLLHELAHIKRGDLWANLAQTLLQIAYFYNPLLWFANAMIRRVREQAVDEMVLVAMGRKAKSYPETLVNVAKLAFKQPTLSLRLIGVVESKNALAGRIKRILTRPLPKSAKLGILGLVVIIVAGCVLLPMAKQARKAADEVAGGPLAIQLVGVQPDGSDDLYDSNGKIKGKSFATKDARWSKDTQYRTFIFELPKLDDSILFCPPSLEIRPAGDKHGLSTGQSPLLDYSDDKLTYSVGVSFPRTYKGWFNKRLKKVDLTLRYHYGTRGHADSVFKGPFSPGQILKAEGGADCELTAIEDRLHFGNTPTAVLKVSSKTRFDEDSVLFYDTSGRRYLPANRGGGRSSPGGSAYNYYVDGLTLDAISYVTVGEKTYERTFKNVVVSYRGRPALDRPEFIDQMCTRLGLSGLSDQQLHQRKIENPADAIKVVDIVRGEWYVRQVFSAIRYSKPKVDLSNLDAQTRQKIHSTAARWAEARKPRIRAMGIRLGLFAGWPESLDLALEALQTKASLSDIIGPPHGRLEQTAKSDVAWEVASYRGPIDDEQVARIKRIVLEDRNPRTTKYLLDFLGHRQIDATSGACWDLAQDDRPWIWWPAMDYLKRVHWASLRPVERLPEEMQKRLILVHEGPGDFSRLFDVSSTGKDYETVAQEAYSILPGLFTPELVRMTDSVHWNMRTVMNKRLDLELRTRVMIDFLREISQPQMQRVWVRDNFFFGRCCGLAFYIARDFNRWYEVNIGGLGTGEDEKGIPRNIHGLRQLIAETLKWYEIAGEKAGETSRAGEAGPLLPMAKVEKTDAHIEDTAEAVAKEKQQYNQDRSRIDSYRKSLTPGRTNNLESFERFADEIQRRWSQRSKEYYALLMLEVCKPLGSGGFDSDRPKVVARRYAL
ncbi:MAG: M56 family metallopeptidase [Planctomycetota bacterium]|jgi:beta-lactamase regulating signal transducer with metallopeptidase domain